MAFNVTAYKSLSPNDYKITPFRTYASHTYVYVSGSTSNSEDVKVLLGREYIPGSELRVENTEQELFDSINQTFYSAVPYTSYGIRSSSYHPTESVFVFSVTQNIFGEEIKPGTLTISIGNSSSIDDAAGNLIVSESGTGSIVGHIFYDKGIAIIKPTSSISGGGLTKNGICIIGGTSVNVSFTSSVTIAEHNIRVKLEPTDFLYSMYNPSSTKSMFTGSSKVPLELMASQSLYPYVTTIGLYNQDNDLLAVAKISNPIQRTDYTTQTFIVKFDM